MNNALIDYNEKFEEMERKMTARGYKVMNPAKNHCDTYEDYIRTGLKQLMGCDTIVMLKGWEESRGARLEKHYAEIVGMEIILQGEE